MIFIKIIISFICGVLGAWGGYNFLPARRFILPVVLGFGVSVVTHIWWSGVLVFPLCGTLCIGYANTGKWWRGMWAFIQAVTAGVGLLLTGHLAWYFYILYCILAGVLGGLYIDWEQILGDLCLYSYLGSIILLVR